jgi:hypothetical protein
MNLHISRPWPINSLERSAVGSGEDKGQGIHIHEAGHEMHHD